MNSWLPQKLSSWRETTWGPPEPSGDFEPPVSVRDEDTARQRSGEAYVSPAKAQSDFIREVTDAVTGRVSSNVSKHLDRLTRQVEAVIQTRLDSFLVEIQKQLPAEGSQPKEEVRPPPSPKNDGSQMKKVIQSLDLLDRKVETYLAPKPRRQEEIELQLQQMEKRLVRKVDETFEEIAVKPYDRAVVSASPNRNTTSTEGSLDKARETPLVKSEFGLRQGYETQSLERTFVVNIRRLKMMLEISKAYSKVVESSILAGILFLVLAYSSTLYHFDVLFLAGGIALYLIHGLQHGMLKTSKLRFGEHAGSDGQQQLDEAIPGMDNPNHFVQALSWQRPRLSWTASIVEICLRIVVAFNWIVLADGWSQNFELSSLSAWSREDLNHLTALNSLATFYLSLHFLFGLFVWREVNTVLPAKSSGQAWDISEDGVPGPLGFLLGPPCVWFGSSKAYDDLRVWSALASQRSKQWAINHPAPHLYPVELGIYALLGTECAMRLARSLRAAKLFDSHRQVYLKHVSQDDEINGQRPSIILTGLKAEADQRGRLYDIDLYRELPEALDIQLVLYDRRTNLSWVLSQVGKDPLDWVARKKMQLTESEGGTSATGIPKTTREMPVWDNAGYSGSSSSTDIHRGTYSGFRTMIRIARGTSSDSMHTGFSDLRAEMMALKKVRDHPNVLSLQTSGMSADGRPFIAIESYESVGCLLSQVINHVSWKSSNVPVDLTTNVFTGLASALGHMHSLGLIHRSVRAEGVVVTREQEGKLADMGVVAEIGCTERLSGYHVAPEACQGGLPQGPEVDCWGLGVVLHEVYQGRSDLTDFDHYPPRPKTGTPSTIRDMELFLRQAMKGLLIFEVKRRWTLDTLRESDWFQTIDPLESTLRLPVVEYEPRRYLRHYLGRTPGPATCAVQLTSQDKGLIGKSLLELDFEETYARVLLVVKRSGSYCAPHPSLQLESGDAMFFGFHPDCDVDEGLRKLGRRLNSSSSSEPPVTGFQASRELLSRPSLSVSAAEQPQAEDTRNLIQFVAEFDCFCIPRHLSGQHLHVSILRELGINVAGLVRSGKWLPEWFPNGLAAVQPGDLCLILRAPLGDGTSAATLIDSDVECVMIESRLQERLRPFQQGRRSAS